MHEQQRPQQLVNDILLVNLLKDIGTNHCVKIRFHELKHKIQISVIFGADDVHQADDIVMTSKLLQTKGKLTIHNSESCDALSSWMAKLRKSKRHFKPQHLLA